MLILICIILSSSIRVSRVFLTLLVSVFLWTQSPTRGFQMTNLLRIVAMPKFLLGTPRIQLLSWLQVHVSLERTKDHLLQDSEHGHMLQVLLPDLILYIFLHFNSPSIKFSSVLLHILCLYVTKIIILYTIPSINLFFNKILKLML